MYGAFPKYPEKTAVPSRFPWYTKSYLPKNPFDFYVSRWNSQEQDEQEHERAVLDLGSFTPGKKGGHAPVENGKKSIYMDKWTSCEQDKSIEHQQNI